MACWTTDDITYQLYIFRKGCGEDIKYVAH